MSIPLLGIVRLAFRRLSNRPALTVLSLLGVILAVGLVSSVPVFAQAVSYLVLRDELANMGYNKSRAPLTMRFYNETRNQPLTLEQTLDMEERFGRLVADKTGLAVQRHMTYAESPTMFLRPAPGGFDYAEKDEKLIFRGFSFVVLGGVEQKMKIIDGQDFGVAAYDGRVPVWVHENLVNTMGLHVGESYQLFPLSSERSIPIYIAGIWREATGSDTFWGALSFSRDGSFLVTADDYIRYAQPLYTEGTSFTAWYFLPEEKDLTLDKVDAFANGLEILPALVDNILTRTKIDVSPVEQMRAYSVRRSSLSDLLINFSLPAVGLLFYFLSLLSTVVGQFQQEETSIMSGRGASNLFLLALTLVETLLLIAIGTPLGLAASSYMVRLMGQTSGFLTFVDRPGFPVSLQGVNWRLMAVALLVLVVARLLPVFSAARKSVVAHMRERSRPVALSWVTKLVIDVPLILVTAYTVRQLRMQDVPTLIRLDPRADAFREPLFLIAPLVCVLTCALVLSHLFPVIMGPLDALSRRLPWVSVYMGVRRLRGQSGQYTSALFLVIICLSLGAFYSSMSTSLDRWMYDRLYYSVGSDYTFRQAAKDPGGGIVSDSGGGGAWVVPLSDYLVLPGVRNGTRVASLTARVSVPKNNALRVRFVGIDRLTFPQVAFTRPDFASVSIGELMNLLGRFRNGLLVSRSAMKQYNVLEGQKLTVDMAAGGGSLPVEFVVVGAYDYFPTVFPRQQETLIGNLDYIFEQTGDPSQYRIWLNLAPGVTTNQLVAEIDTLGIVPIETGDARALIRTESDRVERIGIFGVLSIGFIAGSILSWLGLLVYTSASMQGRMQQIGVLKAIGVQTMQVLLMESVEYIGVIVYGVVGGIAAGVITSYLFVPFFKFNVTAATALPPFLPYIDWPNIWWFALTFAAALVLSEGAILYRATRKDIFQALRMGQRE